MALRNQRTNILMELATALPPIVPLSQRAALATASWTTLSPSYLLCAAKPSVINDYIHSTGMHATSFLTYVGATRRISRITLALVGVHGRFQYILTWRILCSIASRPYPRNEIEFNLLTRPIWLYISHLPSYLSPLIIWTREVSHN